jgi:VWFA-related protein
MRADEFIVLDNNQPRPVRYLWRETDVPLTIGLVVDIGGATSPFIQEHQRTVSSFLATALRPRDKAFLVGAGLRVKLVTDVTDSREALEAGLRRLDFRTLFGDQWNWASSTVAREDDFGRQCPGEEPPDALSRYRRTEIPYWWCGPILQWNAVYSSSSLKMMAAAGRKALLFMTDGVDSAFGGVAMRDAIEAARAADVSVYTIHRPFPWPNFRLRQANNAAAKLTREARSNLRRISWETGGRAYDAQDQQLTAILADIEQDLRTQYVAAFYVPENERDGRFHNLIVKTKRRSVTIRARTGYTALRSHPR